MNVNYWCWLITLKQFIIEKMGLQFSVNWRHEHLNLTVMICKTQSECDINAGDVYSFYPWPTTDPALPVVLHCEMIIPGKFQRVRQQVATGSYTMIRECLIYSHKVPTLPCMCRWPFLFIFNIISYLFIFIYIFLVACVERVNAFTFFFSKKCCLIVRFAIVFFTI